MAESDDYVSQTLERMEDREDMAAFYAALAVVTATTGIVYGIFRGVPPNLLVLFTVCIGLFGTGAAIIELHEARRLRRHARMLKRARR